MKAENYSHSTQSVSDLFIEAKIIIIIFSFYLSVTSDKRLSLAECRDGNSSEIFTPRGIAGWQFTIPGGILRIGMLFHSAHLSRFIGTFGINIGHYNQKY